MNEIVDFNQITRLRTKSNNKCTIYWTNIEDRLLNVYINNEEYKGLTPEEIAEKFGTNYALMQELRYLMQSKKDENIEEIFQNTQSVKKEIIDIFVDLMKEDNIVKDNLSIEEIKALLERNIDAVYIVDDAYREGIGGWYNLDSRNIYVKAKNPKELKEFLKCGNFEKILNEDLEKICHECIHALSPQGLEITTNISKRNGIAVNEGLVQFLTREIISKRDPIYARFSSCTYSEQVMDTEALISVYGKNIIDAYFQGNAKNIFNDPTTMGFVMTSDLKLALEVERERNNDFNTVNEMNKNFKKNLVIEHGIDLYSLCKYGILWPYEFQDIGIKKDSLIKFMSDDSDEFKELLGNVIYHWNLSEQDNKIIWDAIQKEMESQGNVSIENLLKYGLIHSEGSHDTTFNISRILLNIYDNNWDSLLQEMPDIFNSLSTTLGEDKSQKIMKEIIFRTYLDTHEVNNDLPDPNFKYEVLYDLISFERCEQLEQIIDNISSVKDLEYYKTTIGKRIIVNSKNGNIQVVEDEYGWWLVIDDEEDEFCIEKDKDGKYILKSYTTSVDGERIQLDVGLGRNFLDDTTQIDREIMKQTDNLKISEIQSAMTEIEPITKGNKEER